jgi:hypothetical protein
MNKKRKILTVVALAVFGAIIFFSYYSFDYRPRYLTSQSYSSEFRRWHPTSQRYIPYLTSYPGIEDVRMPLFVLGVFYVGLFAILGDNKRKEN